MCASASYVGFPAHTIYSRKSLFRSQRSPEEQKELDETIASIRLRTRHQDPYEEWEKQTRKEAFVRDEILHHSFSNLKFMMNFLDGGS